MRELRKAMRKRALENLCAGHTPGARRTPKQSCITSRCNMTHERLAAADLSERCAFYDRTYPEFETLLLGSIPSNAVAATGAATGAAIGTAASRCPTL